LGRRAHERGEHHGCYRVDRAWRRRRSLSRTPHRNDHMTAVNTAGRSGEVVGGPHRDRRADPGGRPFGDPPVGPYLRMRLAVGRDLDVAGRVVADDALADGGVQRGPQGCSGRRAKHRRSAVAAQHVARGVDAQRDACQRWTEAVVQVAARSPALLLPAHHQPITGSSQSTVEQDGVGDDGHWLPRTSRNPTAPADPTWTLLARMSRRQRGTALAHPAYRVRGGAATAHERQVCFRPSDQPPAPLDRAGPCAVGYGRLR
jgi:hypothetical protein